MVKPANQFNHNDVTILCLILYADSNLYLDTDFIIFWNNLLEYDII